MNSKISLLLILLSMFIYRYAFASDLLPDEGLAADLQRINWKWFKIAIWAVPLATMLWRILYLFIKIGSWNARLNNFIQHVMDEPMPADAAYATVRRNQYLILLGTMQLRIQLRYMFIPLHRKNGSLKQIDDITHYEVIEYHKSKRHASS